VGFLNWGYFVYIINYIYIEGYLLFMGIKNPWCRPAKIQKNAPRMDIIITARIAK